MADGTAQFVDGRPQVEPDRLADYLSELTAVASDESAPLNAVVAQGLLDGVDMQEMQNSLAVLHAANPERTGPEQFRMVRTAIGAMLLRLSQPGRVYPQDYTRPEYVVDGLRRIYDDPALTDEVNQFLQKGALHTSMPQRYVADPIAAMARGHTAVAPVRLDIGCSVNYGNRQVLLRHDIPFEEVQVMVEAASGKLEVDPGKTRLLNDSLYSPDLVVAERVVGIDKVAVKPELIQAYLTPDEIALGGMARLYEQLAGADISPKQLEFMLADIAAKADMHAVLEAVGGKFDVASGIASLYQSSAAQLKRSRNNIRDVLDKDGYAYFLDFLAIGEDSGGQYLTPLRRWDRMNLILYDRHERRLHLVASFTSGRARAVRFFPIFGQLAEGGPFEEVAKELSS